MFIPTDTISLAPITPDELRVVDDIFDDLSDYSVRVDGVTRRKNAALQFATARPIGVRPQNKHPFVLLHSNAPVGLLDILDNYPCSGRAFIGLLAIRQNARGLGLGRSSFQTAERFARDTLHATILRIAVVEANPVIGFWSKMGFRSTGEAKPYRGEAMTSRSILMEKPILSMPRDGMSPAEPDLSA